MSKDITKTTLGELLSSKDETIKRNALSILKRLHKPEPCEKCGKKAYLSALGTCPDCVKQWVKDYQNLNT